VKILINYDLIVRWCGSAIKYREGVLYLGRPASSNP